MINTTDNSLDTKNRIAAIIISPDRKYFLTGKAPNRKYDLNDLVGKGHIEYTEIPETALQREIFEESNINIKDLSITFVDSIKYQQGQMHFYIIVLPKIPEDIKCNSYFVNFAGRDKLEFESFEWVALKDWKTKLYKSLQKTCQPIFDKVIDWIERGIL